MEPRFSSTAGVMFPCESSGLHSPAGKRDLVRTVGPADLSGVTSVSSPFLAEDEKSYAYVFSRTISHLFLVEGAR